VRDGRASPRASAPWAIAAAVLVVDQLSKAAVVSWLQPSESVPLIHPILHLTLVHNTGMAFGLFRGFPHLFAILAVAVAGWIILELRRHHAMPWIMTWALALVLGGAVGNLIDRLRFGYVVDFLDLRVWPVFNVADSAITIGVALLLWESLRPHPKP
jgi:signal peptidase II